MSEKKASLISEEKEREASDEEQNRSLVEVVGEVDEDEDEFPFFRSGSEESPDEDDDEADDEDDNDEDESDEEMAMTERRFSHHASDESVVSRSDSSGSGTYSGSSESSGTPSCDNGEYSSSLSTEDMAKSLSSVEVNVVEQESSDDICAALEEGEAHMVTKAEIRKCRGIESNDDGEEEPEETRYKEAPDFNYITTYEEYLDHYVTSKDLYYFESDDVARTITTLGFRVPELLTREQFAEVMKEKQVKRFAKRKDDVHIAYSLPLNEVTCPLMQKLAEREKQNRTGNMACIIYLRLLNKKNQEVSGWIDFKLRLTKDGTDLWTDYFTGKKKLLPRPSDLCYYNWTTFQVRYNSSDNYLVTTDIQKGLQFMNKLDRKLITVNPKVRPGDNTEFFHVKAPNYLDSALYDHSLRVKA